VRPPSHAPRFPFVPPSAQRRLFWCTLLFQPGILPAARFAFPPILFSPVSVGLLGIPLWRRSRAAGSLAERLAWAGSVRTCERSQRQITEEHLLVRTRISSRKFLADEYPRRILPLPRCTYRSPNAYFPFASMKNSPTNTCVASPLALLFQCLASKRD